MHLPLVKLPELSIPNALSVEEAVTPSAKLYILPPEEPVIMPVPDVPAAAPVAVAAREYVALLALQPLGSDAVADEPIPLKFSEKTDVPVILN